MQDLKDRVVMRVTRYERRLACTSWANKTLEVRKDDLILFIY